MIGLCPKNDIIVFGNDVIGCSVNLEKTIDTEERDKKSSIVINGKALDEIYPDNPVGIGEQHGQTSADNLELTEEKEHDQIEEDAVDEDIISFSRITKLVNVEENEHTREETFDIADREAELLVRHELCVFVYLPLEIRIDESEEDGNDCEKEGDVKKIDDVASKEETEIEPFRPSPMKEEIEGKVENRGYVEPYGQQAEQKVRECLTLGDIVHRVGYNQDGYRVAHQVCKKDDTIHTDTDSYGKWNVLDTSSQEIEQKSCINASTDEDEKMVVVTDAFATCHEKHEHGFILPLDQRLGKIPHLEILKSGIVGVPVIETKATKSEKEDHGDKRRGYRRPTQCHIFPALIDKSQDTQKGDKEKIWYGVFQNLDGF